MIEAIDEVNGTTTNDQLTAVDHARAIARDTVVLSETARATLLSQEGLSITEISDELGITTNVVLADLGIASSTLAGAPSGASESQIPHY